MISFENDYLEGAHKNIINRLSETNMLQEPGYGEDSFSYHAIKKIKETIQCDNASIRFLVGGTQTNQIVIDSLLESYEGVIAPETGHISTHESGAIELTRHKVLTLPSVGGKINAIQIEEYMQNFYEDKNHEHMVFPGMVYISFPTEYGTLYTYEELKNIYKVCSDNSLPLYIDGARLGYALMSHENTLTISQLAELCDVFYIGGTKIGALCGEAVIFTKNNEPKHFPTIVKQHGGLLAKGRLLGVQFLELFTDNLYFRISKHAVDMAMKLKIGFLEKGYRLYIDSPTNQQFFILENNKISDLQEKVKFSYWEKLDEDHTIIRFVTNWATKEESIDYLLEII